MLSAFNFTVSLYNLHEFIADKTVLLFLKVVVDLFISFYNLFILIFYKHFLFLYFDLSNYLEIKFDNYLFFHGKIYLYNLTNFLDNWNYYRKLYYYITKKHRLVALKVRFRHLRWKWLERSYRRYFFMFMWYRLVKNNIKFYLKTSLFYGLSYVFYIACWISTYLIKYLYVFIINKGMLVYIFYYMYSLISWIFFLISFMCFLVEYVFFVRVKLGYLYYMGWLFRVIGIYIIYIYNILVGILYDISHYILYIIRIFIISFVNYFYSQIFLLFIDIINTIFNYFQNLIIIVSKMFDWLDYKTITIQKLSSYRIYYMRRKFFNTWGVIHFPNKVYFLDEKFFIYPYFSSKNFIDKTQMRLNLIWGTNFIFFLFFYYLAFFIFFIFIFMISFKYLRFFFSYKKIFKNFFLYNY